MQQSGWRGLCIEKNMKSTIPFFPVLVAVLIFSFYSCTEPAENKTEHFDNRVLQKLDSLSRKIDSLSQVIAKKAAVADSLKKVPDSSSKTSAAKSVTTEEKTKPVVNTSRQSDSTFHYYTGTKKPAVIFTPWHNQKRKVLFYTSSGKLTYELSDTRMSYSNITEIKNFHPNGAAAVVITHNNPGGSMYMYETHYSFGTDNYPEWKQTSQVPQDKLEEEPRFAYDKAAKSWNKN